MNSRDFSPIRLAGPGHRAPTGPLRAEFLEPAVVQPCFEGMDDVSDWAQTYKPARPADSDDVFSQDEDAEEFEQVQELLSRRPEPTPNGKWMGLALDACAELHELKRLIGELDFFSAGDTGLGRLQQEGERIDAILQRAGYTNGNEVKL